jgi:uncharacterized protein
VSAYLLDVNVLIALVWPEHSASAVANRWFSLRGQEAWATCPMTQTALVRLLSNPSFSPRALTMAGALDVLTHNLELPGHQFWPDSIQMGQVVEQMETPITGHPQITDAYLIALAMHHKGKLATLDRGILKFAPAGAVEVVG